MSGDHLKVKPTYLLEANSPKKQQKKKWPNAPLNGCKNTTDENAFKGVAVSLFHSLFYCFT